MKDPILTDRGMIYKRNVLLICAVATLSLFEGVNVSQAKIFDVQVGNNLWAIGLILYLYHLLMYLIEIHIGWINWNEPEMNESPNLYHLFSYNTKKTYLNLYTRIIGDIFGRSNTKKPHEDGVNFYTIHFRHKKDGKVDYNAKHIDALGKSRKMPDTAYLVSNTHYNHGTNYFDTMRAQFVQFITFDCLLVLIGTIFAIIAFFLAEPSTLPISDPSTIIS